MKKNDEYIEGLIKEFISVNAKMQKLMAFIDKIVIREIDTTKLYCEKWLLVDQFNSMCEYKRILGNRIERYYENLDD